MILQVVFGTVFVLFINTDELNAASYDSITAPRNLYNNEENHRTGFRILGDIARQGGNGQEAERNDKLSFLRKREIDRNILLISSDMQAIQKAKEFRSFLLTAFVIGVGTGIGRKLVKGVVIGLRNISSWFR